MPAGDQRGRDDKGTVVPAAAGHILPDQHAEPVTVVIPAQGLHLDVLAQHVEAAVFGRLNVKDQGLVRRRGVEPVRPVALIQQAVVEIGLAVEEEPGNAVLVLLHGQLAHSKIAAHLVLPTAHAEGIEPGMLRAPGLEVRHRDPGGQRILRAVKLRHGDLLAFDLRLDLHLAAVIARGDAQGTDIACRHSLHPHGLPDPALGRIPDAAALALLLAAGMAAALGSVADAHRDAQALALRRLGHLRRKGQIAAHMAGHLPVVDPDRGNLIHRPEMEQQALAQEALRQRHRAPIPEILPRFQAALHPGEGRLR